MFSIKQRLTALIIVIAIVSIVVILVSFSTIRPIKDDWQAYVEHVAERQVLLSEIKSQFGYGGAIHNFKNYVLRGTPKYFERIKNNFSQLDRLIDRYSQLRGIGLEEKEALNAIKSVAQKYSEAGSLATVTEQSGVDIAAQQGQTQQVAQSIHQINHSLVKISRSISQINNQTGDVASVTTQQFEMLNSINQNITHINEMSGQTAIGAKQSTLTSEKPARLADQLKQTAGRFNI